MIRLGHEMSDVFDELRIIATERGPLSGADRATIKQAADDFELLANQLVRTQAELIESQAQHIALNERLSEARRREMRLVNARFAPICWRISWPFSTLYGP